jgi:hypothetical protein
MTQLYHRFCALDSATTKLPTTESAITKLLATGARGIRILDTTELATEGSQTTDATKAFNTAGN